MVKSERFIDRYIGKICVFLLSLFRFIDKKPIDLEKKILIVKLWAIGDSILTLTLISALKRKNPDIKIDVLTTKRVLPVFECAKDVDNIITIKDLFFKTRQYDLVFDCEPYLNLSSILSFFAGKRRVGFSNQTRSILYTDTIRFKKDQHMVQNYLDMARIIGIKCDSMRLTQLEIPKHATKKPDAYLKRFKSKKNQIMIGISPGVAESTKCRMWHEERFSLLADKLIEELNAKVIFIDSNSNRETVDKIINAMKNKPLDACGKFSLIESFYLVKRCKIFISNDSGLMHVAAAQGCRTIGLFGPNTPVLWGPYGKGNISIYKTKLLPIIQNDLGIFPEGDRDEFMGGITVDDVFSAVKTTL